MKESLRRCRRAARWFVKISLACAAALPFGAGAQTAGLERAGVRRPPVELRFPDIPASATAASQPAPRGHSAALVTAASAVLPGAGQALLRQRRAFLYVALEAVGLGFYVTQERDGSRQRDRYREISRTVARAPFLPNGPQGSWDYYETMEKFLESGAYDALAGDAIDPESDPATYNGSVWLLARQTYWRDPETPPATTSEEYRAALRFYTQRAVTQEFRWSWAGAPNDHVKYRAAIAGSNSAFRNAEQTASVILANHFLSAVDAYVSVHARVRRNRDGSVSLVGAIPGAF